MAKVEDKSRGRKGAVVSASGRKSHTEARSQPQALTTHAAHSTELLGAATPVCPGGLTLHVTNQLVLGSPRLPEPQRLDLVSLRLLREVLHVFLSFSDLRDDKMELST